MGCVSGKHESSVHSEISRSASKGDAATRASPPAERDEMWTVIKKGMTAKQADPSSADYRAHGTGKAMEALSQERKVADRAAQYVYDASGSSGSSYLSTTVHTVHMGVHNS
mmetsp:Transcript_12001/g.33752  ORF Transcript_12001/g.33752 Transcript_12001/m.33752 type:complete len:111 (-) Transcript_12001:290-622(-)